jgi:hypothetical protein
LGLLSRVWVLSSKKWLFGPLTKTEFHKKLVILRAVAQAFDSSGGLRNRLTTVRKNPWPIPSSLWPLICEETRMKNPEIIKRIQRKKIC